MKKEAIEEGLKEGREQGLQQGREQGLQQGRAESAERIAALEKEIAELRASLEAKG